MTTPDPRDERAQDAERPVAPEGADVERPEDDDAVPAEPTAADPVHDEPAPDAEPVDRDGGSLGGTVDELADDRPEDDYRFAEPTITPLGVAAVPGTMGLAVPPPPVVYEDRPADEEVAAAETAHEREATAPAAEHFGSRDDVVPADDTSRDEVTTDDVVVRDDTARDDTARDDTARDDTARDDTLDDDTDGDDVARDAAATGGAVSGVVVDEAAAREDAAADYAGRDDVSTDGTEDVTPDELAPGDADHDTEPAVGVAPVGDEQLSTVDEEVTTVDSAGDDGTVYESATAAAAAGTAAAGTVLADRDVDDDRSADDLAGDAADETGASHELMPGDVEAGPIAAFWADGSADGLRDRWREIQLRFVDDPHNAVDEAESLVGEAVDALTASITSSREELRSWRHDEGDDTERLRVAVTRYREFLDRILGL